MDTDLPLDDLCSAVQEVRTVTLQTGVAHQVGGLENISIQPKVSFTRRLDLQASDPDVYPFIWTARKRENIQFMVLQRNIAHP